MISIQETVKAMSPIRAISAPPTLQFIEEEDPMVTKEELTARLQSMDLDQVLFLAYRRSNVQWAGAAAQYALEKILDFHFGESTYVTRSGDLKETPKWFRQMYVNISWDSGDVTPGSILQALV